MPSSADIARNAALNARTALLNNGYIRLYSGPRPANANAALSGNTLLAEGRFGATAFGTAAAGVATANGITGSTNNAGSGVATFARAFKSDGTTVVEDWSVGTSGAEVNISPSTTIQAGGTTSFPSVTITQPIGT